MTRNGLGQLLVMWRGSLKTFFCESRNCLIILNSLLLWMSLEKKAAVWVSWQTKAVTPTTDAIVRNPWQANNHSVYSPPQRHYNQLREELAKLKPPPELEAESEVETIDPKGKQYSTDAAQAAAATPSTSSMVPKPTNAPTTASLSVNSIGLGPYVGPNGMFFTDPMDQDLPDVWCRLGRSRCNCAVSERDLNIPFHKSIIWTERLVPHARDWWDFKQTLNLRVMFTEVFWKQNTLPCCNWPGTIC